MARGESKKMQVTNQNSNHRRELGRTLSRNLRTLESSVRANRNRTNSMGERLGLLDGVGVAVSNRPVMFTLRTSNDQILYQWNVAPIQYMHVLQCLECSRARRYCMLMYINMYRYRKYHCAISYTCCSSGVVKNTTAAVHEAQHSLVCGPENISDTFGIHVHDFLSRELGGYQKNMRMEYKYPKYVHKATNLITKQ